MTYVKQTWADKTLAYPVSAARMQHIEDGIAAAGSGGTTVPVTTITASGGVTSYTALTTDRVILCDTTVARVQITLPAAAGNAGQVYTIRKIDSTTHNVFVYFAASETLDGIATGSPAIFLTVQWAAVTIVSDGTNWQRLDQPNYQFGTTSQNAIYYVSANYGSDSYIGLNPWAPKKTITAALGGSRTIYVDTGKYIETVDMTNLTNCRLIGNSKGPVGLTGPGVQVVAPGDALSAFTSPGSSGCEVANMAFLGTGSQTYTGTVFNGHGIGQNWFHDLFISGNVSDVTMQAGTYGGIGADHAGEQHLWERIVFDHCNLGFRIGQNGQSSSSIFDQFFFQLCYQMAKVVGWFDVGNAPAEEGNVYRRWKSSDSYILAGTGAVVDIGGCSSYYEEIDFSETSHGTALWSVRGNSNIFNRCANANNTTLTVSGNDNRFYTHSAQSAWNVTGARTLIDNPITTDDTGQNGGLPLNLTGATDTVITGFQPQGNNSTGIADAGLRTRTSPGGPPTPFASSRWYAAPLAAPASFTVVDGRMYLIPVYLNELGVKFSNLAIHVVTGAAATNARVGWYAGGVGNMPGALVSSYGPTAVTSSGVDVSFTSTNAFYQRYMVWLAVVCQGGTPVLSGAPSGADRSPFVGDGTLATMTGGGGQGYFVDSVTSTLPSSVNPATVAACAGVPIVYYEFA